MRRRSFICGLSAALMVGRLFAIERPRIVLIGDSTVASYPPERAPMSGWGQALGRRLSGRAEVVNLAVPGSSTLLFAQRHWTWTRAKLRSGDYLLMQFGHVDALDAKDRHTEPDGLYTLFLRRFADEARNRGGRPILVTPVVRHPISRGPGVDSHLRYCNAMRSLAREMNVLLLDLAELSAKALEGLERGQIDKWFMFAHDGHDGVHLSQLGADEVASMVIEQLERAGVLGGVVRMDTIVR